MITALANFGGASGGLASAGRSAIWDETGKLLVQLGPHGSGVAILVDTQEGRRTKAITFSEPDPTLPA